MTSRKFRTTIAVLAAALGVSAVAGVPAASADSPNLTIKYNGDGFEGQLQTAKKSCREGRTVKVFKKHSNGSLMDTTDSKGYWDTGNSGKAHGKFYATVAAKSGCAPATSMTITLP
jgi:hypothetical protein